MKIKVTSGHYGPRDESDGFPEDGVSEEEFKPESKQAAESAGGTGKVLYTFTGEGAVPHELRQAARWALHAIRADLRISWPIRLLWISELSDGEKSYLEQYPQDRDELEVFELDERVFGLAVGWDKIFITARKCDPLEIIETVFHEAVHLIEPAELRQDKEASERDAKGVAAFFISAFFGQMLQDRRIYV